MNPMKKIMLTYGFVGFGASLLAALLCLWLLPAHDRSDDIGFTWFITAIVWGTTLAATTCHAYLRGLRDNTSYQPDEPSPTAGPPVEEGKGL